MAASPENTKYTVYVVCGDTRYNITPALDNIDRVESTREIAQRVTIQLRNVKVGNAHLSSIFKPRNRIFVYANDGTKEEEVFRGYLWKRGYKSSLNDQEIQYTCYDNLIYFQESEDSLYFSDGKSTKDIMASICEKWGIKLQYAYESITHSKMPLRGNLADIFLSDILEPVRKKTGKKSVVLSDKDTMHVKKTGSNDTIYHFLSKKNVISAASGWTMEGVITQVVIVGKADDDGREPVEATVSGKTSEYGTLQKIQELDENTSLSDAKLEAKNTIDEFGEPKWEYEITAPDIPWIRKGDKVYVSAGDIYQKYLIVTEIDRTATIKKCEMTLTLEDV